jgi:hypothetical protein
MSTDSDDEADDGASSESGSRPYVGTRLSDNQIRQSATRNNAFIQQFGQEGRLDLNTNPMAGRSRENNHGLRRGFGDDEYVLGLFENSPQPTVWEAVNYPREDDFEFFSYYIRYLRQPEAQAIIDKPVDATWSDSPTIRDAAYTDVDGDLSEFDRKVQELMSGDHTRRKPIERLKVLDKMARLGHYAVMVFGFGDGRDTDTPVGGASDQLTMDADSMIEYESRNGVDVPDDITEPEFRSLDDLMYLAVFGEDRVVDLETNHDLNSERYRLPEWFDLVTEEIEPHDESSAFKSEVVHWSRVLHVPEGTLEDDLEGIPALKPCFHELLNIDKIRAASGEGYWRAGYQGLHVRPPQDAQGNFMEFEDGGEGVHQEIQEFLKNFDRTLSTPAQIDSIESTVSDPMPHIEANYQAISAATDIPQSIISGEDRADTADATDLTKFERKIMSRRRSFATAKIVRPFIQRLIDVGVLPEPEGDGFTVEWPPLDELTDIEEWELKSVKATAIKTLAPSGDTSVLATVPELRAQLGWNPNVGGNVSDDRIEGEQEEQNPDRAPLGQASTDEIQEADSQVPDEDADTQADTEADTQADTDGVGESVGLDTDGIPVLAASDVPDEGEIYGRPVDAKNRARELGLDGDYTIALIDGDISYLPGESIEALAEAVGDSTATNAASSSGVRPI